MKKLEEILVKVETLEHSAVTEFRKCRGSSINEVISVVVNEQFETGDVFLIMLILLLPIKALFTHFPSVVIVMKRLRLVAHHVKMTQIIMIMFTTHIFEQNQNTLHKDHLSILGNLAWSIQTLLLQFGKL